MPLAFLHKRQAVRAIQCEISASDIVQNKGEESWSRNFEWPVSDKTCCGIDQASVFGRCCFQRFERCLWNRADKLVFGCLHAKLRHDGCTSLEVGNLVLVA